MPTGLNLYTSGLTMEPPLHFGSVRVKNTHPLRLSLVFKNKNCLILSTTNTMEITTSTHNSNKKNPFKESSMDCF
ncbi:hypothetical protein PRUPE_1G398800 [Prunus persica]|uniref:Uncharacterized protein n=1 Tax=Prunus persica TaxID=3760 RepID=M5XLN7_PRUPE|nr:hypothetical protein PRUPE_1G398800 [Prunus persica]